MILLAMISKTLTIWGTETNRKVEEEVGFYERDF